MTADLSWGIKRSFLGYLESLPDCLITTEGGADRDEASGAFRFQYARKTELDGGGHRLEFNGDVRIRAHGGMLLVIFMNPWLSFTGSRVELSVVDLMHWPDTSRREILGISENTDGTEFPLNLAESALETFNGVYPAGEPLDPAILVHV
ncbi:HtaA domain-containing protein [Corynebacterium sp. YIM 101645]|uniref:HtaA domain-containing protein n=1 Tax=Corynebacterium lemuris TaxID=1859292 RepID=A0ABT2FSN9_9CORY|nr:HtaA domain-containing protein [Corynebacterium lemuris]MCS5478136.1 HtaA domain-containing protein [Corynebacterium lemuris]